MIDDGTISAPVGLDAFIGFYGDPRLPGRAFALNPKWEEENIVTLVPPYKMFLAWDTSVPVSRIRVHRHVRMSLVSVLSQIKASARVIVKEKHGYARDTAFYDNETRRLLSSLNLDKYGGGFEFRLKRGSASAMSVHSFGAAIDIDPSNNGMGDTTPAMPKWVCDIFRLHGWTCGIDFKRIDAMHFQYGEGY